jgi:hypothetical protein
MTDRPVTNPLDHLVALGRACTEIASLSPMVIALRADAALGALVDPEAMPTGEPVRMVAEKIDAAAEGAVAAMLESGLAFGRVLGGCETPFDAVIDVARAAVEPARSRLRANVRRLGRHARAHD